MKSAAPREYGGYHWNAHMPCSHNFHLNGNEWQLPFALLDLQSQGEGRLHWTNHTNIARWTPLSRSLSLSLSFIYLSERCGELAPCLSLYRPTCEMQTKRVAIVELLSKS